MSFQSSRCNQIYARAPFLGLVLFIVLDYTFSVEDPQSKINVVPSSISY